MTNNFSPTHIMSMIDYTRLIEQDTQADILDFFKNAQNKLGHVAAVCIYPDYVLLARDLFQQTKIKIATVVNFPAGTESLDDVVLAIGRALFNGANEIDVVFPYKKFLSGDLKFAEELISTCKAACGDHLLKVILETGAIKELDLIHKASVLAIQNGADFLKTSTGKIAVGATLPAAETMLRAIKTYEPQVKKPLGLKVSGGIRDLATAVSYIELAANMMGENWVTPTHFRIGASQLVNEMLNN